ncbi:hypothetical protein [Natrinema amylolyticum]|uniref:hypothetical protein n=1 Tax=Natrinema amylolyticum TaxID=2878679 RepID=UPI001CFB733D|nr:hypothetical protein [Natrinema amylolyticum]
MEDVREAVDRVWKDPRNGEYRIELGKEKEFRRRVISVSEDLNLDNDRHRLSEHGVVELVQDILLRLGKTIETTDEDLDLKKEFENQKQVVFSEVLGNPPNDYQIVFPLNLQVLGSMPDEIDIGETNLELIKYEEWQEKYLQPAIKNQSSNFESFYEENPNDPDRFSWSYWRVIFPARDARYAIYEVQDTLQLLMAEINFIHHKWGISMPRPAGSGRAPRDRWSHLQSPFVFLAFSGDEFERYYALDYDYRGGLADRTFMPNIEDFDSLPGFYKQRDELSGIQELIANTLILFQDGITEPVFRRSFFDFWRGIEHLAGKEGLDNEEIVKRAVFALHFVGEFENGLPSKTEEAINELDTTRNMLTHDWPDARILERHRDAAKVLLDGLLTLYLEHWDEYDMSDFQYLLEFGTMTQSEGEIEQVVDSLERLGVLEEETDEG